MPSALVPARCQFEADCSNRDRASIIANMRAAHFNPYRVEPQPCWWCEHFDGVRFAGSAAACALTPALA